MAWRNTSRMERSPALDAAAVWGGLEAGELGNAST